MDSHAGEQQVSAAMLEAVARESAALAAAHRQARTVRLCLFLAVVAFIVVIAVYVVRKVNHLQSEENLDKMMASLQEGFGNRTDDYRRQLLSLVNKVKPELIKAVMEQAKKDQKLYKDALDKQRPIFTKNLEEKFEERINKHYASMEKEYDKILKDEFPQTKDEKLHQQAETNLKRAVKKMLQQYYVLDLKAELETLLKTWDSFPPAPGRQAGEMPLEDQFLDSLLELLTYRLTHHR
jgi:hypothetical protein